MVVNDFVLVDSPLGHHTGVSAQLLRINSGILYILDIKCVLLSTIISSDSKQYEKLPSGLVYVLQASQCKH